MKKTILILLFFTFVGFYSCKDETVPVVALKGDMVIDQVLNTPFEEPGYVGLDNEDGDITDKVVVDSVDVNSTGKKEIKYTVSDSEGNTGEAVRIVNVYNEAKAFEGVWTGEYVYPYPYTDKKQYNDNISLSTTKNMGIVIENFGNNQGVNIEGVVSPGETTITFASGQTINGEELTVQRADIADGGKITFEYTIGTTRGVLVLAKK
jgi:asparagine N-glycosylation enzyme membrane subunit Stt3